MCVCEQTNSVDRIIIQNQVVGYGRSLSVSLNLGTNPKIYSWYDHECDQGIEKSLNIYYCPLCGRKLI